MITETPTDLKEIFDPFYAEALYIMSKGNGCLDTFRFTKREEKRSHEYSLLDPAKEWRAKGERESPFGLVRLVEYNLQPLIQLATQDGMTAMFSSGHYSDKPRLFVFPVNVPPEFRPYTLLHEVVEENYQGVGESATMDVAYATHEDGHPDEAESFLRDEMESATRYPHVMACSAEIEQVFSRGQEFSQRFSEWLMRFNSDQVDPKTFFNQAIPGFLSRNQRLNGNPLRALVEFYVALDWTVPYRAATPAEVGFFSEQ